MKQLIILCIVILIVIGPITRKKQLPAPTTEGYPNIIATNGIREGEKIQVHGTIQGDNNFPIHTHSIMISDQTKIGLRSSSINLNNFLGEFTLIGTVHTIKKNTASMDVEYIKSDEYNYIIMDNIYTYIDSQIIINLNNLGSIYSFSDNDYIYIVSDNIPIITIKYIDCAISTNQNTQICEVYNNPSKQFDSFISTAGHTFYKITDGARVIIGEDKKGYIIESDNDENIIDFSHTIEIINANKIISQYKEEIFTLCDELTQINSTKTEVQGKNIILTTQGINTENKQVGCKVTIDMWDDGGITTVSLF